MNGSIHYDLVILFFFGNACPLPAGDMREALVLIRGGSHSSLRCKTHGHQRHSSSLYDLLMVCGMVCRFRMNSSQSRYGSCKFVVVALSEM
jgi:hypothetical protein